MNMLPLQVQFRPEKDWWIATAPELDLATQGETFEQAAENMKEALALFFESCLRRGTLEEVLEQAGFTPVRVNAIRRAAQAIAPSDFTPPECRA